MNNTRQVSIESRPVEPDDKVVDHKRRDRHADQALRRLQGRIVSIQDIENEDQWDELLDALD